MDPTPPEKQLWLIGGTAESAEIARALAGRSLPHWITVTTAGARGLYPAEAQVQVGAIATAEMAAFIARRRIGAIVDASHPFARAVSEGAIAAATQAQCPYLRFERPGLASGPAARFTGNPAGPNIVARLEDILTPEFMAGQRLLLILGYRSLPQFAPWQGQAELFARILPSPTALTAALAAGFSPQRLIALRPPVSAELEAALWQQWGITQVVAKASGEAGGEAIKRQVAETLGVRLSLIRRPEMTYPQQTDRLAAVLVFAQQHLRSHSDPPQSGRQTGNRPDLG